jgi:hypothetical protein
MIRKTIVSPVAVLDQKLLTFQKLMHDLICSEDIAPFDQEIDLANGDIGGILLVHDHGWDVCLLEKTPQDLDTVSLVGSE